MLSSENCFDNTNFFDFNYPWSFAVSIFAARIWMTLERNMLMMLVFFFFTIRSIKEDWPWYLSLHIIYLCAIIGHPSNFAATRPWDSTISIVSTTARTTDGWMIEYFGYFLIKKLMKWLALFAEKSRPSRQASALQRFCASSPHTTRQHLAIATSFSRPTDSTLTRGNFHYLLVKELPCWSDLCINYDAASPRSKTWL